MMRTVLIMSAMMMLVNSGVSAQSRFELWEQPSFFRGFCISDWDNLNETFVSTEDFQTLAATGANLVVIQTGGFLSHAAPYGENVWDVDEGDTTFWRDVLDGMVSHARTAGMYYVIGVRSGPGRVDVAEDEDQSTVWTNTDEQRLYGHMLARMAGRYLPDTLFVGLDLTVEPNPLGDLAGEPVEDLRLALQSAGIDMNGINALWIDSVRTVAPDLPLLVQAVHWSNPAYFSLMEKQIDDHIIYKTHCYNPYDFSHADAPFTATYPGIFFSLATQTDVLFDRSHLGETEYSPVAAFQSDHNVPVMIGEFGLQHPENGGELYLSDIMQVAEERGWHFALWNWNNTPTFRYPQFDASAGTHYMDTILAHFERMTTDVRQWPFEVDNTASLILQSTYPNPLRDGTTIQYRLSSPQQLHVTVCDLLGRPVRVLFTGRSETGLLRLQWDGRDDAGHPVPAGSYILTAAMKNRRVNRLLVRLR